MFVPLLFGAAFCLIEKGVKEKARPIARPGPREEEGAFRRRGRAVARVGQGARGGILRRLRRDGLQRRRAVAI